MAEDEQREEEQPSARDGSDGAGDLHDDGDGNGPDRPLEGPRPDPGTTAPLDEVTDEERKSGPMGVMPGAGPDPDEAQHSGAEVQEAREERKDG